MRTGRILKLADDNWIEVWPNGNFKDLRVTTNIPKEHLKTFPKRVMDEQPPILVRYDYWLKLENNGMRPLIDKNIPLFLPE